MASPPHILVVDDDPILRAIALEVLCGAGYACAEAQDGDAALRHLQLMPADLVVLDMLMPNKDGVETIMAIRKSWPDMKVIGISGGARSMGPDQLLTMASMLGAHAVMTKPLRAAALLAMVADVLNAPPAARVA